MCAFYLCSTQIIAWVLTPVGMAFQLRYLESQREVGEGTAPRGRVTPLDHGAVEITDLNLVRSHCPGSKGQHRERLRVWRRQARPSFIQEGVKPFSLTDLSRTVRRAWSSSPAGRSQSSQRRWRGRAESLRRRDSAAGPRTGSHGHCRPPNRWSCSALKCRPSFSHWDPRNTEFRPYQIHCK